MKLFTVLLCFFTLLVTSYSFYSSEIVLPFKFACELENMTVVEDKLLSVNSDFIDEGYDLDGIVLYIKEQCHLVGVNYSFAVALLREENSAFFGLLEGGTVCEYAFETCHNNLDNASEVASRDLGLWQLNDSYLWDDFVPRHWHGKTDFDWKNPYHSTYVAVRHINWLYNVIQDNWIAKGIPQFQNTLYWETAIAYNAGVTRVLNKDIPASALDYASRVMEKFFE